MGYLDNAKPCRGCASAMISAGIRKIYYSNANGEIVCEKVSNIVLEDLTISSGFHLYANVLRTIKIPYGDRNLIYEPDSRSLPFPGKV